jgi:hypothetical protein
MRLCLTFYEEGELLGRTKMAICIHWFDLRLMSRSIAFFTRTITLFELFVILYDGLGDIDNHGNKVSHVGH